MENGSFLLGLLVQLMMVNGGFLTLLEFCYSGLKLNLLTFLYIPVLYEEVHCLQLTQSVYQPLLDLLDQVHLSEEQQMCCSRRRRTM